jgi:ion channel-forming bestrophin family protein
MLKNSRRKKGAAFLPIKLNSGIPIVGCIFYVLASLEIIAEEIEEPFGGDENDLPLGRHAKNIQVHIDELI